MFETNSSSVHSICISKKPVGDVKGKKISFYLGEYGWENSTVDTPDYLYTAIMCQNNSEELLDKLKSILDMCICIGQELIERVASGTFDENEIVARKMLMKE